MSDLPELSKAEYDVIRILWKQGPLSVRELHDRLQSDTRWAYTTTKTVMDRMAKKELLARENYHGVNVYRPLVSRPRGLARLVHFFARRVLETDDDTVVAMFSGKEDISAKEIKELKQLLKQLDRESREGKQ